MKRTFLSLMMALCLIGGLAAGASAADYTTPVTLTVVSSEQQISVTVPASLPVSVVDGCVLTAENAAIRNTAASGSVQVTAVSVQSGAYTLTDYENFDGAYGTIALSLNGCGTTGAGFLSLNEEAFPVIAPGESLPIKYDVRVAGANEALGVTAATLVFTIAAV